jgi:hypothetical protein
LVDLKKILAPGRRRKKPRADAPRTIVPPADRFDAAKARLREQIPPKNDD